jgi:hypothetical protein
MTGVAHPKVNAGHLKRNAYLYVRQGKYLDLNFSKFIVVPDLNRLAPHGLPGAFRFQKGGAHGLDHLLAQQAHQVQGGLARSRPQVGTCVTSDEQNLRIAVHDQCGVLIASQTA